MEDSYKKLHIFNTVESFWGLYNYLPSVTNGMFFLMREKKNGRAIFPLWEDPTNINGGGWSFKVHKNFADNAWLELSTYLIGETICPEPKDIIGISISPKKYYVTIRVWNADAKKQDVSIFPQEIQNINFNEAIYRQHKE